MDETFKVFRPGSRGVKTGGVVWVLDHPESLSVCPDSYYNEPHYR